jgi:hypothetical protein
MIHVKSLISLLLSGNYVSDQTSAVGYLYSPPFRIDIQFTVVLKMEPYSTFSLKKCSLICSLTTAFTQISKYDICQVSSLSASLWCFL